MTLPETIRRVCDSVLGAGGHAAPALRVAAANRAAAVAGGACGDTAVPEALQPYVDKLIDTPYRIVDRDIETLKDAGLSEDEIFELTVATAIGAAVGRYEKALQLLDEDGT